MFIEETDYQVVIGETAFKVVAQASPEIRANAGMEAIEEISGYLRPKFDCARIFSARGAERNRQLLMYACDIVPSEPDGHGHPERALRTGSRLAEESPGRNRPSGSANRH